MNMTNKSVGDALRKWHIQAFQKLCTKLPRDKRMKIAELVKQIIEILKTKEV